MNDQVRKQPETFTRDGFHYSQLQREGMLAIFEQRRPGAAHPVGFEVVQLRVGKAHPRDVDQSPKEQYPSSEEWGVRGWSYLTLVEAQRKAASL